MKHVAKKQETRFIAFMMAMIMVFSAPLVIGASGVPVVGAEYDVASVPVVGAEDWIHIASGRRAYALYEEY